MKLTGLHMLLTYKCIYECDHCFVWGSPRQTGTMTLRTIDLALRQAVEVGSVEWVYFEGKLEDLSISGDLYHGNEIIVRGLTVDRHEHAGVLMIHTEYRVRIADPLQRGAPEATVLRRRSSD